MPRPSCLLAEDPGEALPARLVRPRAGVSGTVCGCAHACACAPAPGKLKGGVKKGPAFERQRRKMAATTGSGERRRRACWRMRRGLAGLGLGLAEAVVAGTGLRALPAAALGGAARAGTSRRRPEARAGAAGPWAVRPSRRFRGRLRGLGVGEAGRGAERAGERPGEAPTEPARATGSRGCLVGDAGATRGSTGGDGASRAAGEATPGPSASLGSRLGEGELMVVASRGNRGICTG